MPVDKSVPRLAVPTLALWAGVFALWGAAAWAGASGVLPSWAALAACTAASFWAFTPMHDAAHGSVGRAAWVNRLVGESSAVALNAPFAAFRHIHLTHHRFTNEPGRDPDHYSGLGPAWALPLRWLSMELNYYAFYFRQWGARPGAERAAFTASMALQLGALAWLVWSSLGAEAALFWLIPARLATALLAFSFDWLPHQPYAATQAEDRCRATHVISLAPLTPLWLWQNYHLIHHLYPALPCYRYARVWREEKDELLDKGARDLWEDYRPSKSRRRAPVAS